jgi:hypothetical protein
MAARESEAKRNPRFLVPAARLLPGEERHTERGERQ